MFALRAEALQKTHLLGIEDLSSDDITTILNLADSYVGARSTDKLKGRVILNLFLENSTRTRLSFEMAAKRLGAEVLNMSVDGSSIKKGESFDDTLKTLGALKPDALVIRASQEGAAHRAAELLDCPVLNGGDGTREHPTQALLDALTLRRHFGKLQGLNIAICGDILHSRVAHSNAWLLSKMGATVKWIGPSELLPQGLSNTSNNMDEGIKGMDAIMMLRIQKERLQKSLSFTEEEYFVRYGLTRQRLETTNAVVLHPGPMNRGVEITGEVADGNRSLILTQVEMGVAVRMACLDLLI